MTIYQLLEYCDEKIWAVGFSNRAQKQLEKLPKKIQESAYDALDDLQREGVNPTKWNVRKTGDNEYRRLRLNYRYRMRYIVIKEGVVEIEIFYVGHRKDAY